MGIATAAFADVEVQVPSTLLVEDTLHASDTTPEPM